MYYSLSSFLCISVFITHHPFYVISGKYKDLVTSIYPFNKPEEGWCWPAEILQQRLCSRCLDQPLQYIFYCKWNTTLWFVQLENFRSGGTSEKVSPVLPLEIFRWKCVFHLQVLKGLSSVTSTYVSTFL